MTLCRQVAIDAARELHQASVVHRDLGSENLAFRENGAPKVVDFDLAVRDTRTQA